MVDEQFVVDPASAWTSNRFAPDRAMQRAHSIGQDRVMKLWKFPAGAGTTRYLVVAHLDAYSSVSLVAPAGFTVARWWSGAEPEVVRGQWISPMDDLEMVVSGDALELDLAQESDLVDRECQRWR